jgi:flagellar hook-associated protein 3 FlgL
MGAQSFANLQASLDRLQGLQERLSSGKRVQRPSDDPTSMGAALKYRTQLAPAVPRSIDDARVVGDRGHGAEEHQHPAPTGARPRAQA